MSAKTGAEGFVLAGGGSTRMGQDKALLVVGGRRLIEIALEKLQGSEIAACRIAGATSDLSAYGSVVADLHPGCGPLGGIEAALAASVRPLNLMVAVDLPLLPARFLSWMLERAEITSAPATVPRILGRPQPLCAVYHRALLGPIRASLLAGNYKVMQAVTAAAAGRLDIFDVELLASTDRELSRFSPLPVYRWFHNCNTPEDVAALRNALVLSS